MENVEIIENKNQSAAAETTEKAEKRDKKKTVDKLEALKAEQQKRLAAVAAAEKKAKDIEAKIIAEEKKRHEKDIKLLDSICAKNIITYSDIINFIEMITENNLTLKDVTELIGAK